MLILWRHIIFGILMIFYNCIAFPLEANWVNAEHQLKGTKEDIELTRAIRKRLIEEKTLSWPAQNILIVTLNGTVTLKGEVNRPQEIARIEKIAKEIAKNKRIKNELTWRENE